MGGRVWYWYYDVNPDNVNDCLAENKDIIRIPSDAPLSEIEWLDLNPPARAWVRRYFTALAKETLGRVRGKFSGALKVPKVNLLWTTPVYFLNHKMKIQIDRRINGTARTVKRRQNDGKKSISR